MTDNEIIRDLKLWFEEIRISRNKYLAIQGEEHIETAKYELLMSNTLNFINRLQAENEKLKNTIITLVEYLDILGVDKTDISFVQNATEFNAQIRSEIKSEAVKEFAKRLNKEAEEVVIDREGDFVFANDKIYETVADWCKETANNLTKEMVGAYSNETQKETETSE